MAWWRIDDAAGDHPKFLALEELGPARYAAAVALWFRGGCYCAKHRTDGAVPRGMLRGLTAIPRRNRARTDLVSVGLWVETDAGWRMNGWRERNPSREDRKAKTAMNTARQDRWRKRKRGDVDAPVDASTPRGHARDPIPSQPNPSQENLCPDGQSPRKAPKAPSIGALILGLEEEFGQELSSECRDAVGLSRKRGKVSDSVWLRTLQRLKANEVRHAKAAMAVFVDRHGDGEKAEGYLVKIASNMRKAVGAQPKLPMRREPEPDPDAPSLDQLSAQMDNHDEQMLEDWGPQ
jgi:hypothetical protein